MRTAAGAGSPRTLPLLPSIYTTGRYECRCAAGIRNDPTACRSQCDIPNIQFPQIAGVLLAVLILAAPVRANEERITIDKLPKAVVDAVKATVGK